MQRKPTASALLAATLLGLPSAAKAQTEGDYLYNVTMVRAAPGHFEDLIAALRETTTLLQGAGENAPFWVRAWSQTSVVQNSGHTAYQRTAKKWQAEPASTKRCQTKWLYRKRSAA